MKFSPELRARVDEHLRRQAEFLGPAMQAMQRAGGPPAAMSPLGCMQVAGVMAMTSRILAEAERRQRMDSSITDAQRPAPLDRHLLSNRVRLLRHTAA